jgi:RND family efflux transporter MFP subunit
MRLPKRLLPLLILVAAVVLTFVLIKMRPAPPKQEAAVTTPLVEVEEAKPVAADFVVRAQGTVQPRTQTVLVSEVSGVVVEVADQFNAGGFFRRGDVLLRIDQRDYQAALRRAEAAVANREALLAQERARAEQALRDWENLRRAGTPSDLVLRKPYVAEAEANLRAAQAELQQARINVDRTVIRAPYDGLLRDKRVDVGQFVGTGTQLAELYATDVAEIRLPLTEHDASFVTLPPPGSDDGIGMTVSATIAGVRYNWPARLVRSERVIDERSRVLYAVARIDDPYSRKPDSTHPHVLSFGTFVNAELPATIGHTVVAVPRVALRGSNQVMTVDAGQRLRLREVHIVRSDAGHAYVDGGIAEGERIIVSSMPAPVEGMQVRVNDASAVAATSGQPTVAEPADDAEAVE